jgi:hypothetical protein
MRSVAVVVLGEFTEYRPEVALADHDYVVQALSSDGVGRQKAIRVQAARAYCTMPLGRLAPASRQQDRALDSRTALDSEERAKSVPLKRMSERMSAAGRDGAQSGSSAGIRIQTQAPRGPPTRPEQQPLNQTVGGSSPSAGTTLLF